MKKKSQLIFLFTAAILCIAGIGFSYYIRTERDRTTMIYVGAQGSPPEKHDDSSSHEPTNSPRSQDTKEATVPPVTVPVSTVQTTSAAAPETTSAAGTEEVMYIYVDINTAGHDELVRLPGIGDSLAESIIAYRQSEGGFLNTEEIMNVSGIGEGIFSGIREYIYVVDPVYPEPEEAAEPEELQEPPAENEEEELLYTEPDVPELTLEEAVPIDLNTADKELLMLLPHVTDEAAEEILWLRDELRGFDHTYELALLETLTRQQVSEILEYVKVGE